MAHGEGRQQPGKARRFVQGSGSAENGELTPVFDGQPKEIVIYATADGAEPFTKWLDKLRDAKARARIVTRLDRLREQGNSGDYKEVGGVYELRIDYGPGYRLYLNFAGRQIVVLLCGGDKGTQDADIKRALKYWQDHQERETP